MSSRELVVLGTASQAPTRRRSHNGYVLRWDEEALLFDPGEGTQRQMVFAGVSAPGITRILLTHFHGDHCLGLPGVLQRMSLDRVAHDVDVYFPSDGAHYFERLRNAAIFDDRTNLRVHSVEPPYDSSTGAGGSADAPFKVVGRLLDHRATAIGWRIHEPDSVRMLPEHLERAGVRGRDIGILREDGSIEVDGRTVRLEEVSEPRRGQSFAFVMDTRLCDAAFELASGADLLVCEATFLEQESDLARDYGHLTAAQAATIARESGARRLVLTHFSQRHSDEEAYLREAKGIFDETIAATDLEVIPVPKRP